MSRPNNSPRRAIREHYDRTRGGRPVNFMRIGTWAGAAVVALAAFNTCSGGDEPTSHREASSSASSENPSDSRASGNNTEAQPQESAFSCMTGTIDNIQPTEKGARAFVDLKITGAKTARIVMPRLVDGSLTDGASLVFNPGASDEKVSTSQEYEVGQGEQDTVSVTVDISKEQYGDKFGIYVTNENGAQINCDSGIFSEDAPLGQAPIFHNFANDGLPSTY